MPLQITFRSWFALFVLVIAIYLAIPMIPLATSLLVVVFLTALLALLINPLANVMEKRGIKRGLTVAIVLILVLGLLGASVALIVPLLIDGIGALARNAQQLIPEFNRFIARFTDAQTANTVSTRALEFLSQGLSAIGTSLAAFFTSLGDIAFTLFVVVACVFTLVSDPTAGRELMRYVVPKRFRRRLLMLIQSVSVGLSRWFIAQSLICLYYTVCYAIMNTILGIPYAIAIALVAGLLSFIPYLGGFVGMALTLLAAITISPTVAIIAFVAYTIIGSVDIYFVSPYLYSRAVEVRPAVILLGLFIGGKVGGFLAALLTVPVITLLTIVLREIDAHPSELIDEVITPSEAVVTTTIVQPPVATPPAATPVAGQN